MVLPPVLGSNPALATSLRNFGKISVYPALPVSEETLKPVGPFYLVSIGLYRENAIAIDSEAYRDPNGGNIYYITIQISFPIPELARKERNLH